MTNIRRVSGIAFAALLLGASGVMALGDDVKLSSPNPAYEKMVGNTTIRDRYIAAAWSRMEQFEKEKEQAVQVTVTLQRSLSPSSADELVEGLGLKLVAWDAMAGKGTVHRYTGGRISDDVTDVVKRLQRDVDPNLTTDDIKVVALFGTIDPADAMRGRTNEDILSIDPAGDMRVSGKQKSRFAPHLFWILSDYHSK